MAKSMVVKGKGGFRRVPRKGMKRSRPAIKSFSEHEGPNRSPRKLGGGSPPTGHLVLR